MEKRSSEVGSPPLNGRGYPVVARTGLEPLARKKQFRDSRRGLLRSRRTVEPARANTRRGSSHPTPSPHNYSKARDRPRTFHRHQGPSLQAYQLSQNRSAMALLESMRPTLVGHRPRGAEKGYTHRLRESQKCLPTLPRRRQTSTHAMRVEGTASEHLVSSNSSSLSELKI